MKTQKFETGRRDFLVRPASVAGGFMIGVNLSGTVYAADAAGTPAAAAGTPEVTHWIVIQPDDTVVIRLARSELGQGSFTGLAQLVAEELECDWSKVRPEYADVNDHIRRNRIFGSMSTGGSRGIRESQEDLRKAGATAVDMQVAAAAQEGGVPAGECKAVTAGLSHPCGRQTAYT